MALTERLSKKTDVTQNWLLQFVRLTVSGFAEFSEVSRFLVWYTTLPNCKPDLDETARRANDKHEAGIKTLNLKN